MSTVSEVFGELRNVFAKYIPWHSESEMTAALSKVDTAIKEAEDFEKAVIAAANADTITASTTAITAAETTPVLSPAEPADPTRSPVFIATNAADASATANQTIPTATLEDVSATTATATATPAAADPYSGPLFPGSYTPPPVN